MLRALNAYVILVIFCLYFLNLTAGEKYLGISQAVNSQLIVRTSLYGPIYGQFNPPQKGSSSNVASSTEWYRSFRGLRYAVPPVGNLRFASPVKYSTPPGSIQPNRVLDARNFGAVCYQFLFAATGREDCLYINVNTPHPDRIQKNKLLPVIVWIFGGAYYFGAGNFFDAYDPRTILANNDVMYVTFNHRVSIFGFYNGSWGYQDCKMALQWTIDNIREFGGDPDNITMMGFSSGASIISFMMQDLTAPLFKRAWMVSPPLILRPKSVNQGSKLAKILARYNLCFGADDASVLQCMRQRPALLLLSSTSLPQAGMLMNSFDRTPISDAMFWSPIGLTRPTDLLENNPSQEVLNRLGKFDVVIGNTKDELALFTQSYTVGGYMDFMAMYVFRNLTTAEFFKKLVLSRDRTQLSNSLYMDALKSIYGNSNPDRLKQIVSRYPPGNSDRANVLQLTSLLNRNGYHCITRTYAQYLSNLTSVRLYEFQYQSSYTLPIYGDRAWFIKSSLVTHGLDLPYYFNAFPFKPLGGNDSVLATWMTQLSQAFVNGKTDLSFPNATSSSVPGWNGWPEFNHESEKLLVIGNDVSARAIENFHTTDCQFFDQYDYNF